ADAEIIECVECVRTELDAGADLAECRSFFEHKNGVALLREAQGRGKPADAAAGDQNPAPLPPAHRHVSSPRRIAGAGFRRRLTAPSTNSRSRSRLRLYILQQFYEFLSSRASDNPAYLLFMPGGQAFDRHERCPSLVGQEQRMRTPVSECSNPLRPTPSLQLIQQSREARPLDVQGLTDFRLRPARIGADQNERGI